MTPEGIAGGLAGSIFAVVFALLLFGGLPWIYRGKK